MPAFSFLDRKLSIAGPGFNRWLVPPAALAIHLSVGQAYAFSVFNKPMAQMIGIHSSAPQDWTQTSISLVFSIAIVFLGLSAAVFGKWLEAAGPRKAMFASGLCFAGGFLIASIGLALHQLWLVCVGYGVVGGIGLGIGYISPVSTLLKWFPDRPGMATGMAIMGFGGGAMIGSPLAVNLMAHFSSRASTGIVPTFAWMGLIYFAFMMFGVFTVRVPPEDWTPTKQLRRGNLTSPVDRTGVTVDQAIRTPQFWLLWLVLFVNVTAGIGVLSQASPMIQEVFKGQVTKDAAAGFVGLLSLFNLAGRFFWSSLSDVIGRKPTYTIFLLLGIILYSSVPAIGHMGAVGLFVTSFAIVLSMYGGGFAAIPAYLRDLFGTIQVGAIHGKLLTAWSAAGICGPMLVAYLYEHQRSRGASAADCYLRTMYIIAGLLVFGLIANFLVATTDSTPAARVEPDRAADGVQHQHLAEPASHHHVIQTSLAQLICAWLVVGIPLAWGVRETVGKSLSLFH